MSAAGGIRVLANYRSGGINAHRDGRDSTWIVNDNWCGSVWQLQKPVAPTSGVIISSYESLPRIDVPNDSPDTVRHIIGLKDPAL